MSSSSISLTRLDVPQLRTLVGGADIDYTPFGSTPVVQPGGSTGGNGGRGGGSPPGAFVTEIIEFIETAVEIISLFKK